MTTRREGGMREPMWLRAGLMRRLLLATSLTLFVFSDVVPSSPSPRMQLLLLRVRRQPFGRNLDLPSTRNTLLRRRDRKELTTAVMGTLSCARGTSASLAALRRQMPLQLRGGDGGGGGRDRDIRDTRGRCTMRRSMQLRGPTSPPALPAGWEQRETPVGKCILTTTMTAQRIGRCRVRLELSFRGPTSARARNFKV